MSISLDKSWNPHGGKSCLSRGRKHGRGRKHAASVRIPRPLWEAGNTKPGALHVHAAVRTHDVHLRELRAGAPVPCWDLHPRPRIARRPARRRDNAADDAHRPNPPLDRACRRRSSSACRRAIRRKIGLGSGHPGAGRLWGSTLRCVYRKASGARAREASQHLLSEIHFFMIQNKIWHVSPGPPLGLFYRHSAELTPRHAQSRTPL